MELLLLLIYAFFVWLIFIKFKLLPWNFVSQVIVITIPFIGLTVLILFLNIFAPSSSDVRVMNYVVPIVPRVTGRVVEVPVEPNRPMKQGDVLFRVDPAPFELEVQAAEANIATLEAKLVTAEANQRSLEAQLKAAANTRQALLPRLDLARKRVKQFDELAATGAGNRFDLEQSQSDVLNLESQLASLEASEMQVREKLAAKLPNGDQDEVAQVKAQIAQAKVQLAQAQWNLGETVCYAPADGTVVGLALRPGAVASQFAGLPVMSYVENEQWVVALFGQNEVREVEPGNEAEITLKTHPNRIIKCKVDSIMWATAQGQLPISGSVPNTALAPVPEGRLAVRLKVDDKDKELFLAAGARGKGAIYTEHGEVIQILRKVILRIGTKLDWVVLKLH
ncbi:MAG TPA: HlyD family secretion protein [Candidatus Hydrogenedentes bacterium]|nr:HlyD family secretion protein [Candidatus Hydrogenedentota bacterium]